LFADALLLFERGFHDRVTEPVRCSGLDDPQLPRLLPKAALAKLREESRWLGLLEDPQYRSRLTLSWCRRKPPSKADVAATRARRNTFAVRCS
jgi:hypothetical protein